MVNKKKRNRQNGPDEEHGSDSTESWDDSQGTNGNGFGNCPHVHKSVDLTRVKKSLKTSGIAHECVDCNKELKTEQDEDTLEDANPGLWLCLKCGHQSCGRERRQHALKHFQTPRSDSHAVVVNTELWNVWCYDCDLEVPATYRKKLHECVEFIKRQEDAPIKAKKPASLSIHQNKKELETTNVGDTKFDVAETNGVMHSPLRAKEMCPKDLPRVRGLRNIGNTCFFNAVLQCLGQTPFLLTVLEDVRKPGTKFTLPGGKIPMADNEEDLELQPIEGVLGKLSNVGMTESLASVLEQLQSSEVGAINPEVLLKKLTVRCPQFAGYDQHDSHELLRHLLEGVRAEDLKRYQSAILSKLGLSEKVDPSQVDTFLRIQAKHYGRQASDLCLYPDQVFRGFLVSTLECQDCMHASQRVESFLDLSLPVMADKPQPPTVTRRKSNDDPLDFCSKDNQPSKHQQKKERKQAKKGKKKDRQGKGRVSESGQGEPTIDEENVGEDNNSGESEQTDADVEDNADQDGIPEKPSNDVSESGYCSEKAATESPADSPVSHSVNGGDPPPPSPTPTHDIFMSAIPLPYVPLAEISHPPELVEESAFPSFKSRIPLHSEEFTLSVPLSEASNHELAISIPSSDLVENKESGLSPNSNHESLSPGSSDVNIDMTHNSGGIGEDAASLNADLERPVSRFEFNPDDSIQMDSNVRLAQCSPVEDEFDSFDKHNISNINEGRTYNRSIFEARSQEFLKDLTENMGISSEGHVARCSPAEDGDDSQLPSLVVDDSVVTQDEVEHLLSELRSILPETECNEYNVKELAEGLRKVSISEKVTESGNGDVCAKPEVNGHETVPGAENLRWRHGGMGDASPSKERKEDSMAWGATMGPKYTTDDGECSIQSCLNQFTAIELMTGNNKVGCENCTKRYNRGKEGKTVNTNATKQFLVSSPPPVLILHLKRFQMNRSVFKKLHRPVSFPLVLDLAPLIAAKPKGQPSGGSSQRQVVYSLYGIVEHSGHMAGGHYVAYVKVRPPLRPDNPRWGFLGREAKAEDSESCCESGGEQAAGGCVEPPPGKWYFVSDSQVNEVSEDRVLRSQAYLLFYERIW